MQTYTHTQTTVNEWNAYNVLGAVVKRPVGTQGQGYKLLWNTDRGLCGRRWSAATTP